MTKGKKILAVILSVTVLAGGGAGGAYYYRARQAAKHKVAVTPVANLMDYYWGDGISMDGTVISGDVQNVILSSSQMVEKVLVKEGDKVTKGTPLLDYDMTAVALDVAQKKTALAVAEDNVRKAQKELERLKQLRPSEEAPAYPDDDDFPDFPDDDDSDDSDDDIKPVGKPQAEITAMTQAATGTGTADDPYQFVCSGKTVVRKAALEQLQTGKGCAVFVVYNADATTALYAWLVRGDALGTVTLTDWTLGEQITVTDDGGVQVRGSGNWFGTLQVGGTFTYDPASNVTDPTQPATTQPSTDTTEPSSTEPADTTEAPASSEPAEVLPTAVIRPMAAIVPLASSNSENYLYTREQLKQRVKEQEIQIQSLQIAQKKAKIDYESAEEKQKNAQELSKIDGVVTKVAKSAEDLQSNEPYLVVKGSGGVVIQGKVSEMNLDKLTVGATISVNSWETGEVVSAEVTKIETAPTSYDSQSYGGENPNNSAYPFQATVTEDTNLSVGDSVSLSFSSGEESDHFYLPMSYVRQENGRYYVMKKSKENTLEKQTVQTGKIVYGGYSIEIISGIDSSDEICFPYGKYVAEGAAVKEENN